MILNLQIYYKDHVDGELTFLISSLCSICGHFRVVCFAFAFCMHIILKLQSITSLNEYIPFNGINILWHIYHSLYIGFFVSSLHTCFISFLLSSSLLTVPVKSFQIRAAAQELFSFLFSNFMGNMYLLQPVNISDFAMVESNEWRISAPGV